jgi:histidyl-tRNA synthetase
LRNSLEFDLTLARGLNYYTGAIIEVRSSDVAIGSVCGGGRYDNLTGIFGLEGVSGVGVSFGADRIYDVLNQLDLFPAESYRGTSVLILNFGDSEIGYGLKILSALHGMGVSAMIYPDPAKLKKQMSYADSGKIPYVIMAGEDESARNELTIKNMSTGEQKRIPFNELPDFFQLQKFLPG